MREEKINLKSLMQPVKYLPEAPQPQQKADDALPVWREEEAWYCWNEQSERQKLEQTGESADSALLEKLCRQGCRALVLEQGKPLGYIDGPSLLRSLLEERQNLGALLDTLLAITDEAVTIIDSGSVVQGWNEKAQQLYKIPPQDIIGKNINDFFSSLVVTQQLQNALSESAVRNKYHQPVLGTHVMINAAPVFAGEKLIGAVSAEREITQTMRLSNELARSNSQLRNLQSEINKINRPADAFSNIYGQSDALRSVLDIAKRIAHTDVSILLRGESGTGKELFAEAIHKQSSRGTKPFVVINCGAIPANLFESELFGYLPGSFTGADRKGRRGKFDEANHGTIFLDEIGELSLDLQVKLLRVLQNQVFHRVGGGEPIAVDVRVISATHRDLEAMIKEGSFREDLYYRINVISLEIPPLRERKEDIAPLTNLFVREFCVKQSIPVKHLAPEVINYLLNYNWPGNIRELRNLAERMVVLSEGPQISVEHLPGMLRYPVEGEPQGFEARLSNMTDKMERDIILQALDKSLGDRSKAAKLLGIPRSTLYYKLKKHHIDTRYI